MSLLTMYLVGLLMALVSLSHAAPRHEQSSSATNAPAHSALFDQEDDFSSIDLELQRFQRFTSFMKDLHDRIGVPPEARTDVGHDLYVARDVSPSDLSLLPISYNHSSHANEMVLIHGEEIVVQCGIVNDEMGSDWVQMMRCPEEETAFKAYLKYLHEYGLQLGIASNVLRNAPRMQLGTYKCIRPTCSVSTILPASATMTEVAEASPTTSFPTSRPSLATLPVIETSSTSIRKWSSSPDIRPGPTTDSAATRTQPSTLKTAISEVVSETAFLVPTKVEQAAHTITRRVKNDLRFAQMTCSPPPSTYQITYNSWVTWLFLTRSYKSRFGPHTTPTTTRTGPYTPEWVTKSEFATLACRSVWASAWNELGGSPGKIKTITVDDYGY